jgi:hypothetical protein
VKKVLTIFLLLLLIHSSRVVAQEIPSTTEQQLENLANTDQAETEDDTYWQDLILYKKNPININTADDDELKQLRIITDLQIANLLSYRNLFGKLISIYELQSIPAWDVATIKKLLPFITISAAFSVKEDLIKRFKEGDNSLLLRITQILEKAKGFDKSTSRTKYMGSPQKIFFRYKYIYKNLLQFGVTGDKDAGEQFFGGAQKKGFDFYSFHLFARKIGCIQALAIGDFSVSMGQGLIQWQGLAFKKSTEVMAVKQQSAVLRPYTSTGEFYFRRGAGVTIKKGKIESTMFASIRKLSANFVADTVNNQNFVSSFLPSGYHRTKSENEDRNNLSQATFGANVLYKGHGWHVGVNSIYYNFSLPVEKKDEPYNLYAISGKNWYNASIDYSYTYRNLHFFGETAIDKRLNKAFINGLLLSVDPKVDISFVQRIIGKGYQSINGNAFTENTYPTNEIGFYIGAAIRPANGWRIDIYGDIYKFPWLRYLADAPGNGKDFLVQLTYTPDKQAEIYTRFRNETNQANGAGNYSATNYLISRPKQSWRTQFTYKLNTTIALKNRIELLWFNNRSENKQAGFLTFMDVIYKPLLAKYAGILRLQYFETDSYDSRIYAYENDVLYSYSIPAFADKGWRYYLNLNYDLTKSISLWLRWAQTIYAGKTTVGSGLDEITGNRRSEIKLQARWVF